MRIMVMITLIQARRGRLSYITEQQNPLPKNRWSRHLAEQALTVMVERIYHRSG